MTNIRLLSFASLILLLAGGSSLAAQQPPAGMTVTPAQFHQLIWLVGNWRGTQNSEQPFYEGYEFLNDSTIRTWSFSDSTAKQATDSGTIDLREGKVTTGGKNSQYILSMLDSNTVRFDPVRNARNAFTWNRESADHWVATLEWQDAQGKARTRVYDMRRLTSP
jgi:hypothetical protein